MSLPRFLDRVVDATAPVLGGLDRAAVRAKLQSASVTLVAGERATHGAARDGFLFAANLAARLYPRIRLGGPDELVHAAEGEIIMINPLTDVATAVDATTATLAYETVVDDGAAVSVCARGWNVYVDAVVDDDAPSAAAAALVAAALGVGELFRVVFADELGERGRRGRQPGAFNLVTLGEPRSRARACATCGASAETGPFCRMCGARLGEQLPGDGVAAGERRLFRSESPLLWVGLAAALVLALVLLVSGWPVLGAILLLGAVALLVASRAHGRSGRVADELRARAGFLAEAARAWSRTGRKLAVLRAEALRVRGERQARVSALGEAALREDEAAVAALREEARALDARLYQCEEEMRRLVEGTRWHVERERLPFEPTRLISDAAERPGETAEPRASDDVR